MRTSPPGAATSATRSSRCSPTTSPTRTTRTTSRCIGAEAVAGSWLAERDEPGTWEAEYAPALIAGDEVIATGETRYTERRRVLESVAADVRRRRALLALRRVVSAPPGGLAGGQGFEPRYPAPKTGVLPLDDPPGRGRYYDAPVTAPTVLILAAGEGTRMRSAVAEGAASAVRAHDDRVADRRGPRGGRRSHRGRRRAEARARRRAARGRRGRDPGGAQRHRRRGPLGGGADRPRHHGARALRRRAADHRRRDHRARARPRGERRGGHDGDDGARGPERLRARRARRGGRRRAGGGDQDARRRDARGGGDPRGQHRHLRVRGR